MEFLNGSVSGRLSRLVESAGVWTVEISAAGYTSMMTVETGQSVDIYLERSSAESIACTMQEAGEIILSIDEELSMVSLQARSEILPLEKQGNDWIGTLRSFSGVYDLQINEQEWRRNAVVLVDEWVEFDLNTAENVWVIDDLILRKESLLSHVHLTKMEKSSVFGKHPRTSQRADRRTRC